MLFNPYNSTYANQQNQYQGISIYNQKKLCGKVNYFAPQYLQCIGDRCLAGTESKVNLYWGLAAACTKVVQQYGE